MPIVGGAVAVAAREYKGPGDLPLSPMPKGRLHQGRTSPQTAPALTAGTGPTLTHIHLTPSQCRR